MATALEAATPVTWHTTDVAVTQADVLHMPDVSAAVGVRLTLPKLRPPTVTLNAPQVAMLAIWLADATGAVL